MFKRVLVLSIILASLGFFNFSFLGDSLLKLIEIGGIGLIIITIILQGIYSQQEGFKLTFKWEVTFIIIAVFVSMFMAYSAHNQGLSTTLIAQRFMYFYFFYFALHLIKVPDYDLEKIIIYLAIVYVVFYMVQFIAYPRILFNVRISESRGTLRIFQSGLSYLILGYFLILTRIFDKLTIRRIVLLLFFFSVFILMATRQLIFSILFLTLLYILLSKRVKSRILVITLSIAALIPIIAIFNDIFSSILNISQEQSVGFEEDIRILAATFFLTDFFPNNLAYITGNGADSTNSGYGVMVQMYRDVLSFYQSDVGLIGDFSKFGSIFLIAVISIIYKVLKGKFSEDITYIRYFFYAVILTAFSGAGHFGDANSIVTICILLYIIDIHNFNTVEREDEPDPKIDDQVSISESNNSALIDGTNH